MSATTTPEAQAPPPSALSAKRSLWSRIFGEPNALWMREMRQSARLGRTPWILFGLSLFVGLFMCSIGGIAASESGSPAQLGGGLFQAFFSIAYFVVVAVGPAVAANSIASEREGRTWEAVLLTGLHPKDIARGKFMAAYTTIALYIVVLAPVGALPFLFGGVTAVEVVVAFAFLFFVAGLAVAFGLALSSMMSSLRGAIVVTLMLAICIGPALYFGFGFAASFAVHRQWSEVPEAFPIWLPIAYSRASFGLEYVLVLVVAPILLVLVPAWFLYEVTVANLTAETDDRSSGLRTWFFVCTPPLAAGCAVPSVLSGSDADATGWAVTGMTFFGLHSGFCAFLFAFEPLGPSRRVRVLWMRAGTGAVRRFFGPGLIKASSLALVLGVLGMVAIAGIDAIALWLKPIFTTAERRQESLGQISVFGLYGAAFLAFSTGLVSWLRSRGSSPWTARVVAGAILFLVAAGPWVVAAIAGAVSSGHDKAWMLVASPSPFYAFYMLSWIERAGRGTAEALPVVEAGVACAALWGLLGLGLLGAAARRVSKAVREEDLQWEQADAALRAEDAERAASAAAAGADTRSPSPGEATAQAS
jgi:ABC-type transport system involved in multi-copper enzyme maturation permease subunit